jgi:hypothetical protein
LNFFNGSLLVPTIKLLMGVCPTYGRYTFLVEAHE